MSFNLRNRSFVKEIDFEPAELRFLLQLSEALKLAKYAGTEAKRLEGKEIALIFEKTSTRTRSAFEVAAFDQGAHVTYLDPSGSQLGHKESIADTGISMGRAPLAIGDAGLFLKSPTSLIGPDETINVRFPDRRTDHELELGLIIGKTCSDVSRNDALNYVAGYAIALDMTVRGKEDRSFRKSIDGYSVLGPWLVTADEIPNPDALDLEIKVNGQTKQKSNTKNLIYDIRKLIEWASQWYTLYPGDILMTGTPEGVSPVQPGDVLECSIERIGSMTIRIGAHRGTVTSHA